MTMLLLIACSALVGAIIYRLRGGGWGLTYPGDRPIELGAFAALLTAPLWWLAPWWAISISFALAFGATSLGHGSGLDFGRSQADDPDELWRHLWAPKDNPADDFKFMVVRGGLISLAPGVVAGLYVGPEWFGLAFAGCLMAPGFLLGHLLLKSGRSLDSTKLAELLFGATQGLLFGLLWLEVN